LSPARINILSGKEEFSGDLNKTKRKEAWNERPKGRSSGISSSVFPNQTDGTNQEGIGEERF
jgi:hypothetical protein